MRTKAQRVSITRRFQFCAGHRVMGHESKCANLHGHNYVAEITVVAPDIDKQGRVVDFSVIKDVVGGWIDRNWDHGMILNRDDPFVGLIDRVDVQASKNGMMWVTPRGEVSPNMQKLYTMQENPTAENMALLLLDVGNEILRGVRVIVHKVRLWETENCDATALIDPVIARRLWKEYNGR